MNKYSNIVRPWTIKKIHNMFPNLNPTQIENMLNKFLNNIEEMRFPLWLWDFI